MSFHIADAAGHHREVLESFVVPVTEIDASGVCGVEEDVLYHLADESGVPLRVLDSELSKLGLHMSLDEEGCIEEGWDALSGASTEPFPEVEEMETLYPQYGSSLDRLISARAYGLGLSRSVLRAAAAGGTETFVDADMLALSRAYSNPVLCRGVFYSEKTTHADVIRSYPLRPEHVKA